ncbi:MAG: hypothetical protein KA807_15695 [Prolixibacteraceae bacterium]|nr:hypothetical protein [Prolixibacteraceae bacterium]
MDILTPYFRQRLTPRTAQMFVEFPQTLFANFINDIFTKGIIVGIPPKESILGGWQLDITPLTAYSRAGQRIDISRTGTISVWWQGDFLPESLGKAYDNFGGDSEIEIKPLEIPTTGKERWIAFGAIPFYQPLATGVDGYGETQSFSKKITWRFRLIHGDIADQGHAMKPSKKIFFSEGILLCDILVLPGQTSVSSATIDYDRTDWFSIKNLPVASNGNTTSVPALKLAFRSGGFPGIIQVTPTNQYYDRFTFHPSYCDSVTVVRSEIKCLNVGTGNTIIEIDKRSTFDSTSKITLTLAAADIYARSEQQINLNPILGDELYVRCITAGGHQEIHWEISYVQDYA